MKPPLHVLMVEDSEDDARLILRELDRGGFDVRHLRVETAADFRRELGLGPWDLILSDYSLPHFSGEEAMRLLRESGHDLPFIFVSGTIGEDVAVAAMKAGAHDYVMKGNLARLVPAIARELRDAVERHLYREAEAQVRMSEHKYRHLFQSMSDAALLVAEANDRIIDVNEQAELLFGQTRDQLLGQASARLFPSLVPASPGPAAIESFGYETSAQRPDGTTVPVQVSLSRIQLSERPFLLALFRDITARKYAEGELRASEARFRIFVDQTTEAFFLHSEDGTIVDVNRQACAMLGYTREEMIGMHPAALDPDLRPEDMARITARLDAGEALTFETRHRRKDGGMFPVELHIRAFNQDGRRYAVSLAHDITERKLAETALYAREEEFRALAENAPDAICRFDPGCRLTYTNPAYCEALGLAATRLLGRTPTEVYPGQPSVAEYEQRVRTALETGHPEHYEVVLDALQRPNPPCYDIRLVPERDRHSRVSSVLSIGRDITAIKETERQLRSLAENSPDIILRFDRAGRYSFVNRAMELATGLPAAEFLGRQVGEIAALRNGPAVAEKFRQLGLAVGQVVATGVPVEVEMRLPEPDGSELIFNLRLIPETDGIGRVDSVLVLAREITARQRAEEALRSSEQRFRQVTENIDEVFWLTDPAKRQMIYISPAYERVWGRTCASLVANPLSWLEAVHPEDHPRVHSAAHSLQAAGTYDLEYRIVRPDGTVRWIHDRAFPIKDADNRVYRIAGVAEDITAKHQLGDQLRQAQKMESLGTLAGGIAHDFNNILTGVLGSAEVARLVLTADHAATPWLDNITTAGNRARDLVQQILTFGRKQDSEMAPRQLQLVAGEALKLLRTSIPSMIPIEAHIDPACPPVLADDTQIHQVVMNLCTNAWHALPEQGGRIEVGLAPVQVTPEQAAQRLGLAAGPYVLLTVRDNGRGMPPEVRARIFEPFFTTKQQGQGTGLGLAVVHGIIQGHQGAIFVESTPGRGTLFEVFLPALAAPVTGRPETATAQLEHGQGESILLVDDDATALAGLRVQLEHLGYRVTAVSGPRIALERFFAAPGHFDLIITDYAIAEYSGQELATKVLAVRPGFPIILASGLIDARQIQRAQAAGIREVVRKPVPLAELARLLPRLLHPPQAGA